MRVGPLGLGLLIVFSHTLIKLVCKAADGPFQHVFALGSVDAAGAKTSYVL